MAGRQVWDERRGMFVPVDNGPFQGRGYAENMDSQAGNVYRDGQSNRGTRGGQNYRGSRGGQNNRAHRGGQHGNRGGHDFDCGNGGGYNENSGNRGGHNVNSGNRGGYNENSGNRGGHGENRGGYNVNSGNRGGYNENSGNRGGHGENSGNRGGHNVNSGNRGGYNENSGNRGGHGENREGYNVNSGKRGGYNENSGNRGGHGENRGGYNANRGGYNENIGNRACHSGNRGGHNVNRGGYNENSGNRGGYNVNSGNRGGYNENIGNRGGQSGNRGGHNVNRGGYNENSGNRGGYNENNANRGEQNGNRRERGAQYARGQSGGYGHLQPGEGLLPTPPIHLQPQRGFVRPPSNLHRGGPIFGSSTSIPGSQYGQQPQINNMTANNRGKKMPRSFSTSSVNMAGARPKEFSHGNQGDNDFGKPASQDAQYSGKNDENRKPRTQDPRFNQNRDEYVKRNRQANDRHRGQRPGRVNQNKRPDNYKNNEDDSESRATENRGNQGQNQPDQNRRIRDNARNQNTRHGRGYRGMRGTSSRGRNGNANVNNRLNEKMPSNSHEKEDEEIDSIDDKANKSKARSRHGRRGRGTRGWLSNRGGLSVYRNKMIPSVGQIEEDAISESSSTFGSTISLVSEQSEVSEQDVKQTDIDLKLDDLHKARILTLKNREKRYKYRLNDLKKMAPHETVKIACFEEGLALIGNAIKTRTKTIVPPHSEASGGQPYSIKKQELQVEDLDKMSTKPLMDSGDDFSTEEMPLLAIKLPKKTTHLFSKTKQISFKPKQNQKKQHKAKDIPMKNPESVSDSSDEDESNSIDDDTNVIERQDETEIRVKRVRKRRKNKKKEDNAVNSDQNKARIGPIDDLMDKLDNICKMYNTNDNEPDNIRVQKAKDKPLSKDMMQQGADQSKPPGSCLVFDFNATDQKEISNATENKPVKSKPDTSKRRGSSMSDSQADLSDGPQTNAVFKCLVKQLGAESTPGDLVRTSGIFPAGFDVSKWFRRNQRRFTLVERNGEIVNVMAFNMEITYCLDYIANRSCNKPDCERYHICKDLLCGNCVFGTQCKFSHDFLDESNKNLSISKRFGYNTVFTNSEIRSIVSVRYPHLCVSWNENGSCKKVNCSGLHICQRFILGDCFDDDAVCMFSHDKFSEHNKPILDAYRMGQWNDGLFRKMIFIMRSPRQRTVSHKDAMTKDEGTESGYQNPVEEGATAIEVDQSLHDHDVSKEKEEVPMLDDIVLPVQNKHRSRPGNNTPPITKPETATRGKKKTDDRHLLSDDTISDRFMCDMNVMSDGCKNSKCKNVHLIERIPYIWQLKVFGTWMTFPQSELIEEAFCNKRSEAHTEVEWDASVYVVQVKFDGNLHAFVSLSGNFEAQNKVDVRRLSTRSYMQGNYQSQTYKTHWRWYFKDDMQKWSLFETNMQYTLEQKFLANQREYLYSRDNYRFKYMFSFSSMEQTNLDTGKSRDVIRRPIFISREDIEMGSFPESMKAPPKIQTDLPQGWTPWDLCNRFEFVKLSSKSRAYRDVEASFFETLDKHKFIIDDILRVQNPDLWSAYCTEEKVMQANLERSGHEGAVVEKRLLFHGTDCLDAVRGIAINNFDPRISGKNATLYGTGAYFARDSKYSSCYTGKENKERYMFRATVLIGEYTQGKKEYTRPPQKRSKDHELYDSCVNNIDNPEIFILFDRPKYYPEYLVKYHEDIPFTPADDIHMHPASGAHSMRSRVSSSSPQTPTSPYASAPPSVTPYFPAMSNPVAPVSSPRPQSPVRTSIRSTRSLSKEPFVGNTRRSISPTSQSTKSPTKKGNECSIQ